MKFPVQSALQKAKKTSISPPSQLSGKVVKEFLLQICHQRFTYRRYLMELITDIGKNTEI